MVYRKEMFLSALSLAFIRIRGQIMLGEADEDPTLFAAILDIMRPIPTGLLEWTDGSGSKLYEDMLVRAAKHGRLEQAKRWLGEAAARWAEGNKDDTPGRSPSSKNKEVYLKLLEKALDTMTNRVKDLNALLIYANAFHNIPSSLTVPWNEENEREIHEMSKDKFQDNGIWEEVEQWLHEIEEESARTPPD